MFDQLARQCVAQRMGAPVSKSNALKGIMNHSTDGRTWLQGHDQNSLVRFCKFDIRSHWKGAQSQRSIAGSLWFPLPLTVTVLPL